MRFPLRAEIFAARAAGSLSRLTRAGGGTTIPGKLLWKLDPDAIDRLASRLARGSVLVSATNGKTTTAAMVAEILGGETRLAHNRAGANLVSGVASALLDADEAELGLFEVDEAALPEVARRVRPRAVCLVNLFRDQLDRYGELELVAERWRAAVRALDRRRVRGRERRRSAARRPRRAGGTGRSSSGSTISAGRGRRSSTRPTRSTASAAARRTSSRRDLRRPPRRLPLSRLRPRAPAARRRRARTVELTGLESASFDLVTPQGTQRIQLPLPGLYNVYNALAAAALTHAMGTRLEQIRAGLERFKPAFGRVERIALGDRSVLVLLIKNPAGANEVVRTLVEAGAPPFSSWR